MSDQFRSTTVTINNPQGLHMRPAYLFVSTASRFECKIEVIKDDIRIDGKSVLDILTLGATQGTQVLLEATGSDAEFAIVALEELVVSGFSSTAETEDSKPESAG